MEAFKQFLKGRSVRENSVGLLYDFTLFIQKYNPKMPDGEALRYALNLMNNTDYADWESDLKDAVQRAVWTFELEQGIITEEEYLNRPANIQGEVEG